MKKLLLTSLLTLFLITALDAQINTTSFHQFKNSCVVVAATGIVITVVGVVLRNQNIIYAGVSTSGLISINYLTAINGKSKWKVKSKCYKKKSYVHN